MPDFGEYIETGEVFCASEVPYQEHLDSEGWKCPGCKARMVAVAADGKRIYKVVPHFRGLDDHELDCKADGERQPVKPGDTRKVRRVNGEPVDYPNALVLAKKRPQVVPSDDDGTGVPPEAVVARHRGKGTGTGNSHRHYARTLYRIVEFFETYPDEHDLPLRIPGVDGSTYKWCFWKIQNTNEPKKFLRKVMYGAISFKHFEKIEGGLRIQMDAARSAASALAEKLSI